MTTFVVVTPLSNGTLANADGTVRSCQPDGSWQSRPAGTAGDFELCVIDGNVAVYNPTRTAPICFCYAPTVPHASGAAVAVTPL